MAYLYFLFEVLVALLVLGFLFTKFKQWFITEPIKERIETVNMIVKAKEELADEIKPVSSESKKAKKKIDNFLNEGEKLNG